MSYPPITEHCVHGHFTKSDPCPWCELESLRHRLSIRYDGKEIMGVTVTCKRPENHEQITALIRELLDCMTAPTVPDPEVLGDKSPNSPKRS